MAPVVVVRVLGKGLAVTGVAAAVALGIAGCCLVDPAPQADFTWSPRQPLARQQVQFTDLSTDAGSLWGGGVVSWQWDFGDGGSSSVANPNHSYQQGGDYTVRLTVADGCGSSDTVSKNIHVEHSLEGNWRGEMWDAMGNRFQLELVLHQSRGGEITGYVLLIPVTITIYGFFNTQTNEVYLQFINPAAEGIWFFLGTYDPTLDCVAGDWEGVTGPGERGEWRFCRI